MKRIRLLFQFLFALSFPLSSHAYNFLYIHPTTGEPIGWERGTTIRYYLDPGGLGRLTNEQAHTLLKEAMKIWENASPYADVPHFEFAGYLPEDVKGTNYQGYVNGGYCFSDDLSSCPSQSQKDLQTVIVFDEDDSILDNELCRIVGCSASAGPGVFSGSSSNPRNIVQGILVLGTFAGSSETRINAVVGQMAHELGHLLGLAHTSVNQEIDMEETTALYRYLPSMFTTTKLFATQEVSIRQSTLTPDDIAGISVLYPSATFSQNTGTIKGQILKSDGTPMMHVNIVARNVDDPLCEAYSFLSGRICPEGTEIFSLSGGTCFDEVQETEVVQGSGFEIAGIPPGIYTIEVEEIADDDFALTMAPGISNSFLYGDAEFWNENDQASEPDIISSMITLTVGEIKENINIFLNRSWVTEDRIKFIPLNTFTEGPGTLCSPTPSIDYAAMAGIDESEGTGGRGGTNNSNGGSGGSPTATGAPSPSRGCSLIID